MNHSELDQRLGEYAMPVIDRLQSDAFASSFQDCFQYMQDHLAKMPSWQVALPVAACIAVGGTRDAGTALAAAWCPILLASDILDHVEDREFTPESLAPSPETATNLGTSLVFLSFHVLATIQDPDRSRRISGIFAGLGFNAAYGQHRDLLNTPSTVEKSLQDYWEMILLKSGNVFRMATEGGAAAGTSNEALVEALGDYGTAIGVMLQMIDDCRDAFFPTPDALEWEVSLPLLLYLMATGEKNIVFPQVNSRAEWRDLLKKAGVIHAISSLLLEWKARALKSLELLGSSREKMILEEIPSLFLERIPLDSNEVPDGYPA